MSEKKVGHFISEWRIYNGMSQTQLATEIGVTPSNIHHIENGKTAYTQQSLEKIARALKVAPADLIAKNPLHPVDDEETSPFLMEVHSLLSSLSPLSRKLARDFLKSLVDYERMSANISGDELRKQMARGKLAQDFRV